MSTAPEPEHLRDVQEVAALGYLLNAIAHDLNNLLTNLMLGADQIQYGGGPEAVEVLLEQVQRISGITRSVQRLGQRNMTDGETICPLDEVLGAFVRWHTSVSPGDEPSLRVPPGIAVRVAPRHFVQAMSLLALGTQSDAGIPLEVTGAVEERPRSAWVGSTETITMAVVRLRRGVPAQTEGKDFKQLVDGFFEKERGPAEVATMAAWEVVRKVRGRMKTRGALTGGPVEITVELPLAEAP